MRQAPLEPGSYAQAFCTRCKAVFRHTIVALVGGRPVRVKCNTCGGEHVYKAEPPPEAPTERPRKDRPTKAGTLEAEWKAQLTSAAAKGAHGKAYSQGESFKTGDVMDHPSFGVGVVQRAMGPGKVLVLFKDGARTLLCRTST